MEYRWRDLQIGDTFDFADGDVRSERMMKITPRKYATLDMKAEWRIDSTYSTVYNVKHVVLTPESAMKPIVS